MLEVVIPISRRQARLARYTTLRTPIARDGVGGVGEADNMMDLDLKDKTHEGAVGMADDVAVNDCGRLQNVRRALLPS